MSELKEKNNTLHAKEVGTPLLAGLLLTGAFLLGLYALSALPIFKLEYLEADTASSTPKVLTLDKRAYDIAAIENANYSTTTTAWLFSLLATSTDSATSTNFATSTHLLWPVKTVYPKAGALLPFNRIVAYYGNFYSTGMGVLGQYPEDVVLQKLASTTAQWQAADPSTPVIPAIDYIAVTAQGSAGKDGKYRLEMPDSQIDHALEMADKVHGIVILDVQVGLSTLPAELPELEKYLSMPNVHLAIDPEFSMKDGVPPGREIGTFDASDVNFAAAYLQKLVQEYNLPPKILIIHRFTMAMVTHVNKIKPLPEVQMVMDMDGWGSPERKKQTYFDAIYSQPVQFTGFKLFYKNDKLPPSSGMMTPQQVLKLIPAPLFIQYQ